MSDASRLSVSVLGLGAMGARMAARLLDAGHAVTVYNRTPERADPLREQGARVAPTPRDAAAASDVVLAMVRDDDASRALWSGPDGALFGLREGATAVECSTLTPERVRRWAERVRATGASPVEAPVVGSRPQAEAGALGILIGADEADLARIRPVLDVVGGAVHPVGGPGDAAVLKLAVNTLFAVQVAAAAELLAFVRRAGLDLERAAGVLGALPVTSPAAKAAMGSMLAGQFDPLFPVDLVQKDLRYTADTAASVGADVPLAKATHDVFAQAAAAGFAALNITGVARLYE